MCFKKLFKKLWHQKIFVLIAITIGLQQNATAQNKQLSYNASIAKSFDRLNQKKFPSMLLEDEKGNMINTDSLQSKTLYVDFWFTTCPPCVAEIPYAKALHTFFESDTNIVFLNICIENIERKDAWKTMITEKKTGGINVFYARNRPQKVNLLRELFINDFPTYILVYDGKIIGHDAPRPSQKGWVQWAITEANQNIFLSEAYRSFINRTTDYNNFINKNWSRM